MIQSGSGKSVYLMCPYAFFNNDQILKDCCVVPYMFHKALGYRVVLVAAPSGQWTNLEYLPGYETDILEPPPGSLTKSDMDDWLGEWARQCEQYLKKNYQSIDVLFCFGLYPTYLPVIPLYKRLRPDGKVIMKLDANRGWLDRCTVETWNEALGQCDVITCETKRVKRLLSRKWPFKIEYLFNGTYDYIENTRVEYYEKKNIILTVGRIGIWEKANDVMLEAFRLAAEQIPGWSLRLVGGVAPEFKPVLDKFFQDNPQLKQRVCVVGRVDDKRQLRQEYAQAKIFALSSAVESIPNVCAEAIKNGCYMVCSDIDGAPESVGFGKCGRIFPIGDSKAMARIFVEACNDESNFARACYDARDVHEMHFKYERLIYKLEHLLNMKD